MESKQRNQKQASKTFPRQQRKNPVKFVCAAKAFKLFLAQQLIRRMKAFLSFLALKNTHGSDYIRVSLWM